MSESDTREARATIRARAQQLYETLAGDLEHEGDTAGFDTLPEDTAVPYIEAALIEQAAEVTAAERARCAMIARAEGDCWPPLGLARVAAKKIAEAIEEGAKP